MRLSFDKSDPAYNPIVGQRYKVMLNGVPLAHVIAADDMQGEVLFALTDQNGGLRPDPANPGTYLAIWQRGLVEFVSVH